MRTFLYFVFYLIVFNRSFFLVDVLCTFIWCYLYARFQTDALFTFIWCCMYAVSSWHTVYVYLMPYVCFVSMWRILNFQPPSFSLISLELQAYVPCNKRRKMEESPEVSAWIKEADFPADFHHYGDHVESVRPRYHRERNGILLEAPWGDGIVPRAALVH